jgi:release factor glutamine methyltransferase
MKALDKLHDISKTLQLSAIEAPEKEAEIILRNVLETGLAGIYRDGPDLTADQIHMIEQIISRRIDREPLQYIIGNVDFMGLKLHVGPGVLIPRPETELMSEYAIKAVSGQRSAVSILDLCTGSGCLALALAHEFPDAKVYGVDISETALLYARRNAESNKITNVSFLQGNLLDPLYGRGHPAPTENSKLLTFDLIISNPPYIKTGDLKDLQPEVREWEPVNALDGGPDGLDYYRAIIPAARNFLKENGMLVLELGIDSAQSVKRMLREGGFSAIESINDLAGIERIAVGKR